MKRLLATLCLLFGLVGQNASQGEPITQLSPADAVAIHEAVEAQLNALSKDDAVTAFELATLEKQLLIGSPDNFLQMIRELYEPIYRHKVLIFSEPEVLNGMAVQIVRVTDSYSRVWLAVFWMQQDAEANWKIDGCQLLETATVSL